MARFAERISWRFDAPCRRRKPANWLRYWDGPVNRSISRAAPAEGDPIHDVERCMRCEDYSQVRVTATNVISRCWIGSLHGAEMDGFFDE
jgi:hypothetical protein